MPARGSSNGRAKLSETDVAEIKMLMVLKQTTIRQIAASFGVSPTAIMDIKTGRTWRHVEVARA